MNETTKAATLVENAPKRYYRVIDWKQERPKLFDLLVELETAEKMSTEMTSSIKERQA